MKTFRAYSWCRSTAALVVAVVGVATIPNSARASEAKLYANLYEPANLSKSDLAKDLCQAPSAGTRGVIVDIAVGLIGKAAGSLLEGIGAKLLAEAKTLEGRSSIDAFFSGKDPTMQGGCLVIHNGTHPHGTGASIVGVFQVEFSPDRSAWRLETKRWQYSRFIIGQSRQWGQVEAERDFAFRVLLTKPGQDSAQGNAAVLEYISNGLSLEDIQQKFIANEKLPWMSVPVAATSEEVGTLTQPMNLRVTIVETTKPGQLAKWLYETTTERKDDLVAIAKDLAKRSLDPTYAAAENGKAVVTASTAYTDYKAAWDAWSQLAASKPIEPANAATDIGEKRKYDGALNAWKAGLAAARALAKAKGVAAAGAFSLAGLAWPGDLPAIP